MQVGGADVLNWVKNPISVSEMTKSNMSKCRKSVPSNCVPQVCKLHKNNVERYMTQCSPSCPVSYPWLGNPLGQK